MQYLIDGPQKYLFLMALKHGVQFKSINEKFKNCRHLSANNSDNKPNKKLKTESNTENKSTTEQLLADGDLEEELENLRSSYALTMSQLEAVVEENGGVVFEPFSQMENMDLTQLCETANPTVLIQAFKNIDNGVSLYKILEEVKPRFIIMYHSDISAVRQIEVITKLKNSSKTLLYNFLVIRSQTA